MKRIYVLITFFIYLTTTQAQSLKGKIIDAPSFEKVIIKKYNGTDEQKIEEIPLNNQGSFELLIDSSYKGVLLVELEKKAISFELFFDGNPIEFELDTKKADHITFIKSKINQESLKIHKDAFKLNLLSYLKKIYLPSDGFYSKIDKEIKKIHKNTTPSSPLLAYYLDLKSLIDQIREDIKNKKTSSIPLYKENITRYLIDIDNHSYLEHSAYFSSLLSYYIRLSGFIYNKSEDKIKKDLDHLLNKIGYEQKRAQLIVSALIDLFKENEDKNKDLLEFFISKVSECGCHLPKTLEERIQTYENLKIGKKAPNILFTTPLEGIYKQLYQIPSSYTLLMFWSSWCEHCKDFIKKMNQHYLTLKEKNTEFIGILLDKDKENVLEKIEDRKWFNHKDHLYELNKVYDISSTPTFYLLNKDKEILFKSHNFQEILTRIK